MGHTVLAEPNTPPNAPPSMSSIDDILMAEDNTAGPISFKIEDDLTPADQLTLTAASSNPGLIPTGSIALAGLTEARTVTLTPTLNQSGSAIITLTVSDGEFETAEPFTVTVTAVNDPPTIGAIANQAIDEDQTAGPFAFTIDDVDSVSLTLSAASANPGLVSPASIGFGGAGSSRTVTLTPTANQNGLAPLTILVSDESASASSAFSLTVRPVNDPPVISSIPPQTGTEDTAFGSLSFSVNDPDGGDVITLTAASNNDARVPDENIVISPTIGGSGTRTLSLTPAANKNGSVLITLLANDGVLTDTESFSFTLTSVNDPPTLSVIGPQVMNESTTSPAIPFTVNDIGDLETQPGNLVVTATTSNPDLIPLSGLVFGGSGTNRTLTLTPRPYQNGQATITVTVRDIGNLTTSRSFLLTVAAVDDPPTISAVANQTIPEDGVMGPVTFVISDVDTPISTLIGHLDATSDNAQLVGPGSIVLAGSGVTRTITIALLDDANGSAEITVSVADASTTTTRKFTLNVSAVNDPPKIDPVISPVLAGGIAEDTAFATTLHVTDIDNTNLSVSAVSSNQALVSNAGIAISPATGTSSSRQLSVTPQPNASGTAVITLTVSDGNLTDQVAFQLKVNPVNDAPSISPPPAQTIPEDGTTGPLAFTVGDIDSPAAGLQVTVSTSNPALVPLGRITLGGSNTSRTIALAPVPNATGSSQIILTVSDGTKTTTGGFLFTVTPVNDPPIVSAIGSQEVVLGGSAVFTFTVVDVDNPYSDLHVSGESANPAVVPASGSQFRFSPITPPDRLTGMTTTLTLVPNFVLGSSNITVRVSDGQNEVSRSFTLFVVNETTPPTISPIADQAIDEDGVLGPLQFSVNDDRIPAGQLQVNVASSNPALVPNQPANLNLTNYGGMTRTLVVTPTAGQNGVAVITLQVSDGLNVRTESFNLTVRPVENAPSIVLSDTIPITAPIIAGTSALVPFRIGDPDTNVANLQLTAASSNPAVVPAGNIVFGGSGADRTVRITPSPGQAGTVVITLLVSDGTRISTISFTVNVIARISLPALLKDFVQCDPARTDCSEPNNSLQTAFGPLQLNTRYAGTVNSALDRFDFYSVTLESGVRYTISLTFGSGDLDLFLYGNAPLYKSLASSNFQGDGRPEEITYQAESSGVYYILVYGFNTDGAIRPYSLMFQRAGP